MDMSMKIGVSSLHTRTKGVGFSLPAFLAAMDDGFSFDFTKTDRHFQTSTGPTLADDATEAIGLALESREWNGRTLAEELAQQTELKSDYSINTIGSVTAATYNPSTGQGTVNRTDINNTSGVKISATLGKWYLLDIEKTGGTGNITIRTGGSNANSPGSHPQTRANYLIYVDTGSGIFISSGINGPTVDFTLHSIKLVPTHHGVQANGTLKPAMQTGYSVGSNPELFADPGCDNSSSWNSQSGWAITGSKLVGTSVGAYGSAISAEISPAVASGKTLCVRYTVSGYSAGGVRAQLIGGSFQKLTPRSANGVYVEYITTTSSQSNLGFQATSTFTGSIDDISVKEVASTFLQAKFDGSDDNLLTTYTAGATNNFLVALVDVPASMSGTQVIAGAVNGSSHNFYCGFTSAGLLRIGVGDTPTTVGSVDRRGTQVVVGVTTDGTTRRPVQIAPRLAGVCRGFHSALAV